jgi:class 3 adenylate cyclase
VLATGGVKDATEDDFAWSFAGKRKLRGVQEELPLFRARLPEDGRRR